MAIDEAVVPVSPLPIKQQHDGSGDTGSHKRFLDKDLFAPSRYGDGPITVPIPFKCPIDIGEDRVVVERTEKTVDLRKHTAPVSGLKHPLQDMWVFWYYQVSENHRISIKEAHNFAQ